MLNCLLFNARSLNNKLSTLHNLLYTNSYDVVVVTESWLKSYHSNGLIDPEGRYNIIRHDRLTMGGGVCSFISKKYAFYEVDTTNTDVEMLCFDLVFKVRVIDLSQFTDHLVMTRSVLSMSAIWNHVDTS